MHYVYTGHTLPTSRKKLRHIREMSCLFATCAFEHTFTFAAFNKQETKQKKPKQTQELRHTLHADATLTSHGSQIARISEMLRVHLSNLQQKAFVQSVLKFQRTPELHFR